MLASSCRRYSIAETNLIPVHYLLKILKHLKNKKVSFATYEMACFRRASLYMDPSLFFKITNRWYIIFASDLGVFDLLHRAFVQSQNFSVISSIFSISWYYSHHVIGESLLKRIIKQWCAKLN